MYKQKSAIMGIIKSKERRREGESGRRHGCSHTLLVHNQGDTEGAMATELPVLLLLSNEQRWVEEWSWYGCCA
jgi:hypothetical protein